MDKKGKYHLLSYLVDSNLIFYMSSNKNKKIIAFSMIKISEFSQILSMLKKFLKKRYIDYFSIDIPRVTNEEKYILLCFIDYDKNKILKDFNSIYRKLSELHSPITFLENKNLENEFFNRGFRIPDSKIRSLKSTNSIIIQKEESYNKLNVYSLNLYNLDKINTFLYSFTNLIKKIGLQGSLIFTFKVESLNQIVVSCYFIELNHDIEKSFNTEKEVNKFFRTNLIVKIKLNLKEIYKILWRLEINKNHFKFEDIDFLFNKEESIDLKDLSSINIKFENFLDKHGIEFHRLNKNLILIKQKIMLFIIETIDYDFMLKLFKNYYPKYTIWVAILDSNNYFEFKEIKNLSKLEDAKIMNINEFSNFDNHILGLIHESNLISCLNSNN